MALANSTRPSKPHKDFPLFPHTRGYWAKKVRGRLVYFGKCANDPKGEKALEQWLDQKDDLLAGRLPREKRGDELTVSKACGTYLASQWSKVEDGELSHHHYRALKATCTELIVKVFGAGRVVSDLRPDDFRNLRRAINRRYGYMGRERCNIATRSVFNYCLKNQLIEQLPIYGSEFDPPSRNKSVRQKYESNKPNRMLEPAELRRIIDGAHQPLKAFILLALNCGFGNSDCGYLEWKHLDLDGGWVSMPRHKTGISRRCKLWPETVQAIQQATRRRYKPTDPKWSNLVFISPYGNPWRPETCNSDSIGSGYRRLMIRLELHQRGRSFYSLRHIHRTISDQTLDQVACDYVMGHKMPGMSGEYRKRESIADDRLAAVAVHLRNWLYS